MIKIDNKIDCCGCKACQQACPVNCIEMKDDDEGFWYPIVDNSKCINCKKCENVCPIVNKVNFSDDIVIAFAARSNNERLLMASSSGAIFSEIAIKVLEKKGVVFGASFTEDYIVQHQYIYSVKDLYKLQGSKYVQSDIGESYLKAKKFLDDGRLVLFSGTPCQISGLKQYLGKDYNNLLAIDVLCHGVPSPLVWKKYLIEEKLRHKMNHIDSVSFRNKDCGWYDYSVSINYNGDRVYNEKFLDNSYMKLFLRNISLRPSCYDCKFKDLNRASDITLGDCWGVENILPEMYTKKGVSVVVVHSTKGEEFIKLLTENIEIKECDIDEILPPSSDSRKSVQCNYDRERFFKKVNNGNRISSLVTLTEPRLIIKAIRRLKKLAHKVI